MTRTQRRARLQKILEDAREDVCPYYGTTCDCKPGLVGPPTFGDNVEQTGCPEIREMIRLLNWEE